MNFSTEVITIIDELAKRMGLAIDWTAENVMPYLEDLGSRYVSYILTRDIISLVMGLFITIVFIIICVSYAKKIEKLNNNHSDGSDFDYMMGIGAGLVSAVSLFVNIIFIIPGKVNEILACIYLPEKIIFDYISTFIS